MALKNYAFQLILGFVCWLTNNFGRSACGVSLGFFELVSWHNVCAKTKNTENRAYFRGFLLRKRPSGYLRVESFRIEKKKVTTLARAKKQFPWLFFFGPNLGYER